MVTGWICPEKQRWPLTPPSTAVEERGHNDMGGQEQVKKQTARMRDILEGHVVGLATCVDVFARLEVTGRAVGA